jgi:hypothetical protein|eukprot:COSAG01_NODE_237_length_20722_cov_360.895747_9_plen_75_part_00
MAAASPSSNGGLFAMGAVLSLATVATQPIATPQQPTDPADRYHKKHSAPSTFYKARTRLLNAHGFLQLDGASMR